MLFSASISRLFLPGIPVSLQLASTWGRSDSEHVSEVLHMKKKRNIPVPESLPRLLYPVRGREGGRGRSKEGRRGSKGEEGEGREEGHGRGEEMGRGWEKRGGRGREGRRDRGREGRWDRGGKAGGREGGGEGEGWDRGREWERRGRSRVRNQTKYSVTSERSREREGRQRRMRG